MRTRKKNTNTKIVSTHQVKQKLTIWHKVRGYLQGKRHLSRKQAKNSSNERNPPHMPELGANRNLIKQACKERAFPNKTGRSLDARQRHGTSWLDSGNGHLSAGPGPPGPGASERHWPGPLPPAPHGHPKPGALEITSRPHMHKTQLEACSPLCLLRTS